MLPQFLVQHRYKSDSALDHIRAGIGQFFGPYIKTASVAALQQNVALLEYPLVVMPAVQITKIAHVDGPVHVTTPGLGTHPDHTGIIRRKNNRIQFAMQLGSAMNRLAVDFNPATGSFQQQPHLVSDPVGFHCSMNLGHGLTMPDQFRQPGCPERTGTPQKVYRFQQVCFSLTIQSVKQIEPFSRFNSKGTDISEITDRQLSKTHRPFLKPHRHDNCQKTFGIFRNNYGRRQFILEFHIDSFRFRNGEDV